MKRNLFASSAVLAMVLGLASGSASLAKPTDLPSQNGIECADGGDEPVQGKFSIELGITSNGITLKVGAGAAKTEAPGAIDAVLPAYVEQWLQHVGDALMRPDRYFNLDAFLSKMPQFTAQRVNEEVNDVNRTRQIAAAARGLNITANEARLFEPVKLRIKDVPLQQAIKNLAHASGVRIVPDYRALQERKINLDAPVSLEIENTSLQTALRQLLQPLQLTFVVENDVVRVTTMENRRGPVTQAEKSTQDAQRLFETAERYRRSGEYDVAHKLFQQAHLVAPMTLHGRMAIVRLEEIEERMRDVSEEQGGPEGEDPQQAFRDMRDRTVPLGLVERSY